MNWLVYKSGINALNKLNESNLNALPTDSWTRGVVDQANKTTSEILFKRLHVRDHERYSDMSVDEPSARKTTTASSSY